MRILLLHNFYRFKGGEETYFESLAALLKKKGHHVLLYTKDNSQIKGLYSKIKAATSLFVYSGHNTELLTLINKFKPDIAHCNNIYPLITTNVYSLLSQQNIPIVQSIHNYRLFCPKGILFRDNKICEQCTLMQFPFPSMLHSCYQSSFLGSAVVGTKMFFDKITHQYEKISHFIFPSRFIQEYYCNRLPFIKAKSSIIPYYVSDTLYRKKEGYFLYAGRLSEEKGVLELLKIVKELPSIPFKVIGDGPLRNEVRAFTKFPNISVYRSMSRKKLLSVIQRASCVVIPSRWFEVLPYVYLESLASGTPTLTPDTPPFQRKTTQLSGYYYKFNDFNDLREKLIRLSKRTEQHTDQFYEEFRHRYIESKHYDMLKAIYISL